MARERWSLAPIAALAAAAQGHFHEEKGVFEMQVQPLCLGGLDDGHPVLSPLRDFGLSSKSQPVRKLGLCSRKADTT